MHVDAKEIDGTHTRVIEELAMSATVERRGDHHGATTGSRIRSNESQGEVAYAFFTTMPPTMNG